MGYGIYDICTSDVTFTNDPILLNGSLVRTKGTESYLVGMLRSPILGQIADRRLPESVSANTDRRSDRVGGAYGDLPFKVMFRTQVMGLIHWRFHKQQPT